jgi:hypothetical protein
MIEFLEHYTFGTQGSVVPLLGEGWSMVESDFTWTLGTQSSLTLPLPARFDTLVLEFDILPHITPPMLRRQRLTLVVNTVTVAELTIGTDGPLAVELPEAATAGASSLAITLHCPDAATPEDLGRSGDKRQLALGIRRLMLFTVPPRPAFAPRVRPPLPQVMGGIAKAVDELTTLSVPDLASHFESLGHNCEFGVAQRAMGLEQLGLLRFGGISPHKLAEALDLEFEGIDTPGNLTAYIDDDSAEYMVRDKQYGTTFHTHIKVAATTAESVLALFDRNIRFLRRKFLEDLREGGKIFVFQHPEARTVEHARPFLNLLRSHGPNILLFVTEGGDQRAGTVEYLEPDLLHGVIGRLAPYHDVTGLDVRPWIHICANAYRLCREAGVLRPRDHAA